MLETLARTSLVDDRRFAEVRATSLVARGAGDHRVRHELARAGVATELIDETIVLLPPESERATRILERRGPGPKTARYLAGKGFSEDVINAVIAQSLHEPLG